MSEDKMTEKEAKAIEIMRECGRRIREAGATPDDIRKYLLSEFDPDNIGEEKDLVVLSGLAYGVVENLRGVHGRRWKAWRDDEEDLNLLIDRTWACVRNSYREGLDRKAARREARQVLDCAEVYDAVLNEVYGHVMEAAGFIAALKEGLSVESVISGISYTTIINP